MQLLRLLASNADLARRLDDLEKKYEEQFRVVFEAIRELMAKPELLRRLIGLAPSSVEGAIPVPNL